MVSRDGWAALPRGAKGLSAVCDCGISWSYSITIIYDFNNKLKSRQFSFLVKKSNNKTVIDFNFGRHKELSTLKSEIIIFAGR